MAEPIIMPKSGMAMEEGVIIEWFVKEGDQIKEGDVIAQIETDKTTMDLESDLTGTVLKLLYSDGTTVPVTLPIAWIGKKGEAIPAAEGTAKKEEVKEVLQEEVKLPITISSSSTKIAATPAAKTVASEKGIDLATIKPTGKWGEIVKNDVLAGEIKATALAKKVASDQSIDLAEIEGSGYQKKIYVRDLQRVTTATEDRRVALTNIQKITGKRMLESVLTIPQVTEDISVKMDNLLALREEIFEQSGIKSSINDFIILATARALELHRRLNSVFDNHAIIEKGEINIGVAVATDRGLVVPHIKNTNTHTLASINSVTKDLIVRAREGKLALEELSGSTFSISNVGMYKITSFTPIINPPEAAILGVNTIEKVLALVDGNVREKSVMRLSLTFDHRIVDGAEASQFLLTLVDFLENPLRLLI
ncbi:MAG: dihydrolipoamide acetyltransferase family protein [Sphaerochaetaceae bacterium]